MTKQEPSMELVYKKQIVKYAPEGTDEKAWATLIQDQILGRDKKGNLRSTEDMMLFMYVCHRLGLDPLARQIYPVYRWDSRLNREKMTIQTSIDGFRSIAGSSKFYAGSDDAIFSKEKIFNPLTNKEEEDLVARVTVYRVNPMNGERMPVTASAKFNAYIQKDKDGKLIGMWANELRYNQLAKCAEALALRKAFPTKLSGIYTDEEMQQATPEQIKTIEIPDDGTLATPEQIKTIEGLDGEVADNLTKKQAAEQIKNLAQGGKK